MRDRNDDVLLETHQKKKPRFKVHRVIALRTQWPKDSVHAAPRLLLTNHRVIVGGHNWG